MPPLRERREDIPALVAHFLAAARQRAAQSAASLLEEPVRVLAERPWPGNVRELASVIERAVVFGSDGMQAEGHEAPSNNAGEAERWSWPFPSHAPWSLQRLSRAYTAWAIGHTGGNKEQAAAILGINLSTLYRWERSERTR